MRLAPRILAPLALLLLASPLRAQTPLFTDEFANNNAGWTLEIEWAIAPTFSSAGHTTGNGDPAFDHTSSGNNGVAGVVVGGNAATTLHALRFITSPPVNVNSASTLILSFYRWLNSDYTPFMNNVIEVWNGSSWVRIWESGGTSIFDAAWAYQSFDLTPYKNAGLRVRFGFNVTDNGVLTVSSWNLDDFALADAAGCVDEDGDGHTNVLCGGGDCDDSDPSIYAGALELSDGKDNDCDGEIDEDAVTFAIDSIVDVGNDQGRHVRVAWGPHPFDAAGSPSPITSYSLYRRVAEGSAPAAMAPEVTPPGAWDFVVSVPATAEVGYQTVVETLCDSTDLGICWSPFFVRAHTATPLTYYDTPADSGYSTDDLVPNVPSGLSVAYAPAGNHLTWNASSDADFRFFKIYRGSSPDFVPSPGNLVHSTTTPDWTDATPGYPEYKVSAVDFNGNESPAASPSSVVGAESRMPIRLALDLPRPNPTSGNVLFFYEVPPASAAVSLRVYDTAGRLVRDLGRGKITPGRSSASWNGRDDEGRRVASGSYFLRLEQGSERVVRAVTLLR